MAKYLALLGVVLFGSLTVHVIRLLIKAPVSPNPKPMKAWEIAAAVLILFGPPCATVLCLVILSKTL